jgi:hypothetical protein
MKKLKLIGRRYGEVDKVGIGEEDPGNQTMK